MNDKLAFNIGQMVIQISALQEQLEKLKTEYELLAAKLKCEISNDNNQ